MIDLHSHILANVDDGAQSMAISLAMLDEYARIGYSTVVATPHWDYPTDEENQARIQSAYEELILHAEHRSIRLLLGRECMLPPDHRAICDDKRLTLNESRFVLIELPFGSRPLFMEESMFGMQASGKTVILAHPERYRYIQRDLKIAKALVDRGILLQINIGSITGTFGKSAKVAVKQLLSEGLVHIAATDAHSNGGRLQAVASSLKTLQNRMGEDEYRRLVHHNPGLILANTTPEPVRAQKTSPSILIRWFTKVLA